MEDFYNDIDHLPVKKSIVEDRWDRMGLLFNRESWFAIYRRYNTVKPGPCARVIRGKSSDILQRQDTKLAGRDYIAVNFNGNGPVQSFGPEGARFLNQFI